MEAIFVEMAKKVADATGAKFEEGSNLVTLRGKETKYFGEISENRWTKIYGLNARKGISVRGGQGHGPFYPVEEGQTFDFLIDFLSAEADGEWVEETNGDIVSERKNFSEEVQGLINSLRALYEEKK